MAFYSYSPWADAARFGSGVGATLGQALAQRPEIQAQVALMRQRLQQGDASFPLEQAKTQAEIENLKFRPDYMGQILQQRSDALAEKQRQFDETNAIKQQLADQAKALMQLREAQAAKDKAGKETSPWANIAAKLEMLKSKEQELAPGAHVIPGVPLSPSDDLRSFVMNAKTPDEAQSVLNLAEIMPNRETNSVPTWGGWGTPKEQVTTNSYTMRLPKDLIESFGVVHSGEVPNASLPVPNGAKSTSQTPPPESRKIGSVVTFLKEHLHGMVKVGILITPAK